MTGEMSTVVGPAPPNTPNGYGDFVDNVPANTAILMNPNGVVFDAHGNLYVIDGGFSVIRKVTASVLC